MPGGHAWGHVRVGVPGWGHSRWVGIHKTPGGWVHGRGPGLQMGGLPTPTVDMYLTGLRRTPGLVPCAGS